VTTGADGRVGLLPDIEGEEARLLYAPSARGRPSVASKLDFRPGAPDVCLVPSSDGRVRLFDLRAAGHVVVLELPAGATAIAFRPGSDSTFAVGADDVHVRLCDLRSGGAVAEARPPATEPTASSSDSDDSEESRAARKPRWRRFDDVSSTRVEERPRAFASSKEREPSHLSG